MTIDYRDPRGVVWRVQAATFNGDTWEVNWYQLTNPNVRVTTHDHSFASAIDRIRGVAVEKEKT